jgi:hypothetical protein
MSTWKYCKHQGACAACGHSFIEKEVLFSLLRKGEADLERGDLCSACFDARDEERDLFWWRTGHSFGKEAIKMDPQVLLAVLEKLADESADEHRDFRFLLALLLVRSRKVRLVSVANRRGKEVLVLRKVRARQTFDVEVRELTEERRKTLTDKLTVLLDPTREGGLEEMLEGASSR